MFSYTLLATVILIFGSVSILISFPIGIEIMGKICPKLQLAIIGIFISGINLSNMAFNSLKFTPHLLWNAPSKIPFKDTTELWHTYFSLF